MRVLSIVVPCFNEVNGLQAFVQAVKAVQLQASIEMIFVDDGSTDGTLDGIKALAAVDENIHFVAFSRHFGKEAALLAGLRKARGGIVVTMDVDLQDPPALLPEMFEAIEKEGYDAVATRRTTRKGEPPIRSFFARRFYQLMKHFSDVDLVDGARDYRMMTRQVVEAILSLREVNRFTKGIYQWVGFNTKWIAFENVQRRQGETKWSFWKLFKYSLEGMMAFSTMPLQVASLLGIFNCLGAMVAFLFVFLRALIYGDPVSGWPSLVCVIIFFSGVQLFMIGILGSYLAKTYLETKQRPLYFIREEA